MSETNKKSFIDRVKKFLKIGVVTGMTMMSTMSDAQAADNKPVEEYQHIKVSGQVTPGMQYNNIKQQYLAITAEQISLVRKVSQMERMGKKEEAKTFKDRINELQEKRMYLMEQMKKQEFSESLKVNTQNKTEHIQSVSQNINQKNKAHNEMEI